MGSPASCVTLDGPAKRIDVSRGRCSAAARQKRHHSEVAVRRAPLLPALAVALLAACDGGPGGPTRPVELATVDTLRPGQVVLVRGSGLGGLRSLLVDGVPATDVVARSD